MDFSLWLSALPLSPMVFCQFLGFGVTDGEWVSGSASKIEAWSAISVNPIEPESIPSEGGFCSQLWLGLGLDDSRIH